MKTVALVLVLAAPLTACDIPLNIVISSPDPCATLARAESGLAEANKRVWYTMHVLNPLAASGEQHEFRLVKLEDVGILFIYEHPGRSFGNGLAGSYTAPLSMMQWARDSDLRPWEHEMGHLLWRMFPRYGDAWRWAAHGTLGDPYFLALVRMRDRIFYWPLPEAHTYMPVLKPSSAVYMQATAHGCEFHDGQ